MCNSFRMSEQPAAFPGVPKWDVADRLRKALREAQMSTEEMADYLDVSRRSIGNWLSGRIKPSTRTMRLWALRTGVQYEWLCHDDYTPCGPGTPADLHEPKVITGRYSNPAPSAASLLLAA